MLLRRESVEPPMSQLGHGRASRRRDGHVCCTPGFPTNSLRCRTLQLRATSGPTHCRKMETLFDQLIGTGEQHRRDGEAQRFRRFHVDREFEFGRLLDRQVHWFGAL
jgi:hypothetical protein